MHPPRDYEEISTRLKIPTSADRHERMKAVVDALWEALSPTGVSWVGFYLHDGGEELRLGPRRDRPACSPIGLHGACGRAFRSGKPLLVRDVRELGAGYIACDPRDQSELVVPCCDSDGSCWGVLDLDSHELDAFDEPDVSGLTALLSAAGLHASTRPGTAVAPDVPGDTHAAADPWADRGQPPGSASPPAGPDR